MVDDNFVRAEVRSSDLFRKARTTVEHREALLALRERRPARFHDPDHMAAVQRMLQS